MASTYDKKFKTTETTKAAGAEVVSDPIELSPRTKNHILTVTTDNSLSGTVDVEMEMSPDGQNWCPAVSRTVSSGASSSTGDVIGNQESVKLTPDAGEFKNKHARGGLNFDVNGAVVTPDGTGARDLMDQHISTNKSFNYSQWFKTSEQPSSGAAETVTFAVTVAGGVFNIDGSAQPTLTLKEGSTYTFDQSDASNSGHPLRFSTTSNGTHGGGAEYTTGVTYYGTPGSAGAYTQIVVAASAPTLYYYCSNHSGMGGTAETPVNNPYKPVLFRHGGYDNFENTKAVALTAPLSENEAIPSLHTNTGYLKGTLSNVAIGSSKLSTNARSLFHAANSTNSYGRMPDLDKPLALSIWINLTDNATDHTHNIVMQESSQGKIQLCISGGNLIWNIDHSQSTSSTNASFSRSTINYADIPTNTWIHIVCRKSEWYFDTGTSTWTIPKSGSIHNFNTDMTMRYIDGNGNVQTFTSTNTSDVTNITTTPTSHGWGAGVTSYIAWDGVIKAQLGGSTNLSNNKQIYFDETIGYADTELTDAQSLGFFNNGKPIDPTNVVGSATDMTWWRFGDGPNDFSSNSYTIEEVYKNNGGVASLTSAGSSTYWGGFQTLTSADQIYVNYTQITQNLCEPTVTFNNELALRASIATGAVIDYTLQGVTNKNPFDIGGQTNDFFDVYGEYSIGFYAYITNETNFDAILQVRSNGSQGHHFKIYQMNNNIYFSLAGGSTYKDLTFSPGSIWGAYNHFLFVKRNNTQFPSTSNVDLYVNGVKVTASGSGGTMTSFPTGLTVDSVDVFGAAASFSTQGTLNANKSGKRDTIDEISFFDKALTDGGVSSGQTATGEVAGVFTGSWHDLSNLPSSYNLKSYFQCGDGPNDNGVGSDPKAYDIIGGTAYITLADVNTNTFTKEYWEYASSSSISGSISASPVAVLESTFTSTSPFSISGWFKTTDTGTLFSNTEGAAATGLKVDVSGSAITASYLGTATTTTVSGTFNDGEWHHIVMVMSSGSQLMIVDNLTAGTSSHTLSDAQLKGSNGFTLLNDGQNNANNPSPAATDSSKLQASLSNWSIHSEALSTEGIAQLYSNGHVRNIKNLPSVTASAIEAWWQLNDATNPQNDLSGSNHHLQYVKIEGDFSNKQHLYGALDPDTTYHRGTYYREGGGNGGIFNDSSTSYPNNIYAYAGAINFWYYNGTNHGDTDRSWLFKDVGSDTSGIGVWVIPSSGTVIFKLHRGNGSSWYRSTISLDASSGFPDIRDQWNMITFVWTSQQIHDPANCKVYVNGEQIGITGTRPVFGYSSGTQNIPLSSVVTTRSMFLGAAAYPSGYTSTNTVGLDEVAYWGFGHGLTDQNISDLYNNGAPADPSSVNSTSLYRHFRYETSLGDTEGGFACQLSAKSYSKNPNITSSANYLTNYNTTDTEYVDPIKTDLTTELVNATGEVLVEDTINGNAMTLSLTKSFNFTTNEWVSTSDQDTALCLSFNGFEEQAEYFALWKCAQTVGGQAIDICDGGWHNVILSYRGRNDLAGDNVSEGDTVKFGPGPANSLAFNWAMSYDGQPLTALNNGSGADYIGGLNTIVTDSYSSTTYNVGFNIYNRHLKYETSNTEEVYKPHAQFSAGIHEVSGVDNINAFQGYVDETSFHSDTWWVDQAGTSVVTNTFNQEKPATIYGNTTALTNRGASTEYPVGVPYPLLNPEKLNTSGQASDIEGTNQYINPNRYDASTNPNGGLEGWWRWGDTPGDCSITINDVRDHNNSINSRDIDASNIVTGDRQVMTVADSIYNANTVASVSGGSTITFPQVKLEGISSGICNLANINSPLLQFIRVKWKGAGSLDLGEGKGQARLNYTNRRRRRKK